jgi:hypothetical protein
MKVPVPLRPVLGFLLLVLVVGLLPLVGAFPDAVEGYGSGPGDVSAGAWEPRDQAAAFAEDAQDRAATMFLLLFVTSLVGLYIAARHVRKRRNGFHSEAEQQGGPRTDRAPDLEPGEAYLVTQGQSKALKVFTTEIKKGHPGLCITRTYPDKLRGSWDLEGAQVYWLTNGQAQDRDAINSLEALRESIDGFLSREEKGVILLDGVEYLFVQNSFTEVMKLLQNLKDTMPSRGAKLIIPIDLLALVERQRALLAREFKQI